MLQENVQTWPLEVCRMEDQVQHSGRTEKKERDGG